MEAVEGTFRYEREDIVELMRRHMRALRIVVPAVGLGVLVYVGRAIGAAGWSQALADPLALLMLGSVGVAFGYGFHYGPRRMARDFERIYGGRDVHVRIDEVGVRLDAPDRYMFRHEWGEIDRVVETPRLFVLYLASDLPQPLPKRALADRLEAARALIAARTKLRR